MRKNPRVQEQAEKIRERKGERFGKGGGDLRNLTETLGAYRETRE